MNILQHLSISFLGLIGDFDHEFLLKSLFYTQSLFGGSFSTFNNLIGATWTESEASCTYQKRSIIQGRAPRLQK